MPFLHKYLGNPVLSLVGRVFFGVQARDFHCGLRGFDRQRILSLELSSTGMEFASEMVVKASLAQYRIAEVPTTLKPDGRSRPRTCARGAMAGGTCDSCCCTARAGCS